MLFRYEGKQIQITTEDGCVFSGTAEVFPSGYGLHEFARQEESIRIDDVQIFQSDIRKIELLTEDQEPEIKRGLYDELIEILLEGPYWIVDILPEQVPNNADGQYFAVERYYLQPEQLRNLRHRYAEILLRLNCYHDMAVSFDNCESWERNPDPESFVDRLIRLSGNVFLRAMFEAQRAMIDLDPYDTYMTVYDPDCLLLGKLKALAAAEGLFVWSLPETEEEDSSYTGDFADDYH